jgi:large subunit ribosomal protein L9
LEQERQSRKKKKEQQSEDDLHKQQSEAGRLDGEEIEIVEKANENGVLYAAVTPQKICKTLEKMGFKIDPTQVNAKPIKEVGTYPVIIKFGHGLEAEITVVVQSL